MTQLKTFQLSSEESKPDTSPFNHLAFILVDVNDTASGEIIAFEDQQRTDFMSGGKLPSLATKIALRQDNGQIRILWCKGSMIEPVVRAMRNAGRADLQVGDQLSVTLTKRTPDFPSTKKYSAVYKATGKSHR